MDWTIVGAVILSVLPNQRSMYVIPIPITTKNARYDLVSHFYGKLCNEWMSDIHELSFLSDKLDAHIHLPSVSLIHESTMCREALALVQERFRWGHAPT